MSLPSHLLPILLSLHYRDILCTTKHIMNRKPWTRCKCDTILSWEVMMFSPRNKNTETIHPLTAWTVNARDLVAAWRHQRVAGPNMLVVHLWYQTNVGAYPVPPLAFPKKADFRPKLVITARPSTQPPELTWNPVMYSPRRISIRN